MDEGCCLRPILETESERRQHYGIRKRDFVEETVLKELIENKEQDGWEVIRINKKTARMRKPKPHFQLLEDRVWSLFYKMGFGRLSGNNFRIISERKNGSKERKQIDVFAADNEVALVVECKSSAEQKKKSLQKDLHETIALQNGFRETINNDFAERNLSKPKIIWVYATHNIIWSVEDKQKAEDKQIQIFSENEMQYFEQFIRHVGPAGKFQFLGEFLQGQKIPGMKDKKLPAIKGKIGGEVFYSFVATPSDLFKIAFINHFSLSHPDGKPAYQRMINASRIKRIGKFIQDQQGWFPTNILLNFKYEPRFDLISGKENTNENLKFGWLTLPAIYRSAWVIDGQHRLFGFSHLSPDFLENQSLFILAFENMKVNKEADLFVTINSQQKGVPRNLLDELRSEIKMRDTTPSSAITTLASRIFKKLNADSSSPFFRRFPKHGIPAEVNQSFTFSEAMKGLKSSGLIGKYAGKMISNGPLTGTTDEATVERCSQVLNNYFNAIRETNPARWDRGKSGFISTNPALRAHLSLIEAAINFLSFKKEVDFQLKKTGEINSNLLEFCKPLFQHFEKMSDAEAEQKFSRKFGEGGVREYRFTLMTILANYHSGFGPDDFQRWREQSGSEGHQERDFQLIQFSGNLTDCVVETLKNIYGEAPTESGEPAYWAKGVTHERVLRNTYDKQMKDPDKKKKEAYLDIMDLKEIVHHSDNWPHFEEKFKNPMSGEKAGQKYYTNWMQKYNEVRNIAAHPNRMKTYSDDQLDFIDWLISEIMPKFGINSE